MCFISEFLRNILYISNQLTHINVTVKNSSQIYPPTDKTQKTLAPGRGTFASSPMSGTPENSIYLKMLVNFEHLLI